MARIYMLITKVVLAICFQTIWCNGQTLFTIGNKPVSSQSFIAAFNKNPGEGNRKELMEDYLPLYINYVLKVQDAYDRKLDTLPAYIQEMNSYKIQLAENYLAQVAGGDNLVDDKIVRLQTDILLGHIFIAYQNKDTAAALAQAQQAHNRLKKGETWENIALAFTTDPDIKKSKGVAGWITAFSIPTVYEDLVYGLAKGGFSAPIQSSEGVHIFKKIDTRKGIGTVLVSQILLARYSGISTAEVQKRMKLADSLHGLLQKGESFERLVSQFSEDRSSKYTYGLLPAFGPATYDPVFETQAFSLEKPGEFTKPFETSFGWHILKLSARKLPPAKSDTNAREIVRNRLFAAGEMENARKQYIKSKKPAMKYKAGNFKRIQLQQFTDSLLAGGNTAVSGLNRDMPVFYFGKTVVPISDWIAYIRVQQVAGKFKQGNSIDKIYDAFVESKAADYLPTLLDEIEPAFAQQFKEFKDANLLFEAMEREVWGPSQSDTNALKAYFAENANKYTWDAHVVAVSVTATDSLVATEIFASLNKDLANWRKASEEYSGLAFIDSGRFELKVLQLAGHTEFEPGACSALVSNKEDGSYSFLCTQTQGEIGKPRSFEEARGMVVSDYQQVLENNWVNGIKRKYPIKLNEAEWKRLLNLQP